MDIVLVNVKEYDMEKAFNNEVITVSGNVNAVGIDGFIEKAFMKAEIFDNIEHLLTDEQKEIMQDIKSLYGKDK